MLQQNQKSCNMNYIYSAADLFNLKLDCLPATRESIARKAKIDQWEYKEVRGKGGKGGLKRVYKLPDYVLAEIKARSVPTPAQTIKSTLSQTRKLRNDFEIDYDKWLAEQSWNNVMLIPFYADIYSIQQPQAIPFQLDLISNKLNKDPRDLVCICAKGDSMYPTIKENDSVLFDLTINEYDTEGIYLIQQGTKLSIKRLQKIIPEKIHIISDNKSLYSSIEIDLAKSSLDNFKIVGKYLWSSTFSK